MELSRIEYRRLVEDVAEAVLAKVLPFVKKRRAEKPEEQWTWVSAEEAAKIVGLTKPTCSDRRPTLPTSR